jgi:hypothetical protein
MLRWNRFIDNPVPVLVALTIILHAGNFVWDWPTWSFYDKVTLRTYTVDISDNAEYSGIAMNLLAGKGYSPAFDIWSMRAGEPTYFRSPALPFLFTVPLSLFARDEGYRITDANRTAIWVPIYLFQLFLVCVGTASFYKLSQIVVNNRLVSAGGTFLYIIWPANLVYLSPSRAFVPEQIVAPLLLWVSYVVLSRKRNLHYVFAGIVLGCCLLMRTYLVFMPFAMFVLAGLLRHRVSPRSLLITGTVALLVLLPWPARNYLAFNDFSMGSQGGWTLFIANNPTARGSGDGRIWGGGRWDADRIAQWAVLSDLNRRYPGLLDRSRDYGERAMNQIFRQEALAWARANPARLAWLVPRKLAIEFYPSVFETGMRISWITAIVFLGFGAGLLLYVVRWSKGRESGEFLLFTIPIACVGIVTAVFYAEYRQRFLIEGFMLLFALYGAQQAIDHIRHNSQEGRANAARLQTTG